MIQKKNILINLTLILSSIILILIFSINNCDAETPKRYNGYVVIRATPENNKQLKFLNDLLKNDTVDFWKKPSELKRDADFMIKPNDVSLIKQELKKNEFNFKVLISDIEKTIHKSNDVSPLPLARLLDGGFFTEYHRLNEIYDYLAEVASDNSRIASVENIGKSFENRDLRIIRLGVNHQRKNKPVIWIDAGIHAREWISPASALYIVHKLVDGFQTGDASVNALLEQFDWYILPSFNPDGYEYTHTNDRMWRKNRVQLRGSSCRGVDINRNFDEKWGVNGDSKNPCSDIYSGPSAMSELESRAVGNYINANKNRIKSYLTIHSYGQYFMYPYGWTRNACPDANELHNKATIAASEITKLFRTRYQIGSPARLLYLASGGSDDWAYTKAGIKYTYTLELRDTGNYGFILPPAQIISVGEETWSGIKKLVQEIGKTFRKRF